MLEKLDPKFKPLVRQELKKLGERIRNMHAHQNKTYWDMTQEKWGAGGSETKTAAREKHIECVQKTSEEKTEESKTKGEESSEKPEAKDDAATEEIPDVKAKHSKQLESGAASEEALDNENLERTVDAGRGEGAPDNRAQDTDSDPAASTGTDGDSVASRRSACDTGTEKVKCQSSAALDLSRTSQGNRATCDKKGNGDTQ
ncbi:hypothetical protein JOB18_002087 [Solea senegalensis]|uniref:Uncharacterized protein n=1 Tax=Solea senegalensis TaxID=28829 RepID=A0AAV6SJL2_SOLSE|nr:hypothetical protein JOB18_002087 [Solea senegalensis]